MPNLYAPPDPQWAKLPPGQSWGDFVGAQQGPDGNIVVLHRCSGASCFGRPEDPIRIFDAKGRFLRSFGAGRFVRPHGLWVDRQNNIWATDLDARESLGSVVYKFEKSGKLLMTIGSPGKMGAPKDGMLTQPNDVVTNDRGDIFISEGHGGGLGGEPGVPRTPVPPSDRISKFDRTGKFLMSFGGSGSDPGQVRIPHNLAIDSQGRLFVADRQNSRLDLFTQDGRYLESWKQFGRPSGVYIDGHDTLYVSDSQSNAQTNPGFDKGWWVGDARTGARISFSPDPSVGKPDASGVESVGADRDGDLISGRLAEFDFVRRISGRGGR